MGTDLIDVKIKNNMEAQSWASRRKIIYIHKRNFTLLRFKNCRGWNRSDKIVVVVPLEFSNALLNIGTCSMRFFLGRQLHHQLGVVSFANFLDRRNVDLAVVQVVDYLREFSQHEVTVLVNRVACKNTGALGDMRFQVFQQRGLHLFKSIRRVYNFFRKSRLHRRLVELALFRKRADTYFAVGLHAPFIHIVHDFFGIVNGGFKSFVFDNVEIFVGQ